MNGAAPGAKIESVRVCMFIPGCTTHALIEGMTYIAKQGNVDVINMSIGGLPSLNDGNNARAVLYDRLIDTYNVQMFISAGNSGAGLNTIGDPSVASKVVSVGSYISNDTWQKNYGSDSAFDDNLHAFSSARPARGRRLQAADRRARLGHLHRPGLAARPAGRRRLQLPAGLRDVQRHVDGVPAGGGSGGAAGLGRQAVRHPGPAGEAASGPHLQSPRFIDPLPGLRAGQRPDATSTEAWDAARARPSSRSPSRPRSRSTRCSPASSRARLRHRHLRPRGRQGGRQPTRAPTPSPARAEARRRDLRPAPGSATTGPSPPPTSAGLPLNKALTVPVSVRPTTSGVHRAVLEPGRPGHPRHRPPDDEHRGRGGAVHRCRQLQRDQVGHDRPQPAQSFFAVPAGTPAFKVDLTAGGATGLGQVRFLAVPPLRGGSRDQRPRPLLHTAGGGGSLRRPPEPDDGNPLAGVWEVLVEARRTSDVPKRRSRSRRRSSAPRSRPARTWSTPRR